MYRRSFSAERMDPAALPDSFFTNGRNPYFVPQLKKTHGSDRNDPCPCGSGKKFKNCHWRQRRAATKTPITASDPKVRT